MSLFRLPGAAAAAGNWALAAVCFRSGHGLLRGPLYLQYHAAGGVPLGLEGILGPRAGPEPMATGERP